MKIDKWIIFEKIKEYFWFFLFLFFSILIIICVILFKKYLINDLVEQNTLLDSRVYTLNKKISKMTKWSKNLLYNLRNFYQTFFKDKFDLYIIDLWWIAEYVSPSNNFIKSISFSRWLSITFTFKNKEINYLLKVKKRLEKLKEMWIVSNYKLSNIRLNEQWFLLDDWVKKYYEVRVNIMPTEDKKKIRNFLSNHSDFYKNIYDKFIYKKVNYVLENSYKEYIRSQKNNKKINKNENNKNNINLKENVNKKNEKNKIKNSVNNVKDPFSN